MCGIAGILHFNHQCVELDALKKMTDTLSHRGPDGEGQWINEKANIGFGHRRLAILDLSKAGHQPMHYANDRYTITFNGEIYNYIELREKLQQKGYKFKSNTDTEVLLALYDLKKENCLKDLDGMFAFAIWDEEKQELFCAKDRFGEKPFYYYKDNDKFIFASEMKSLWEYGITKEINNRMMFNFLFYNYEFNPNDLSETFYTNCHSLPHSNYLTIKLNNEILIEEYYKIDYQKINNSITKEKAARRLKELLYSSISNRLRSDVPVGSSLSGGLDSSIIVSIINDLKTSSKIDQQTYSAYFEGFEKNEKPFINLLTNQYNINSSSLNLANETYSDIIDKVVYHQEEPFNSLSILAQNKIMELAKINNTTVLLDGQGADEVLAGYHSCFNIFFKETYYSNKSEWKIQYNSYKNLHAKNTINKFRSSSALKYNLKKYFPFIEKQLNKRHRQRESLNIPDKYLDYYEAHKKYKFFSKTNFQTLNEELYYHSFNGPLQQLLKYSDRNSMSHSVEVRLPYLSHELVEFIFSLPSKYKINNGWTKWILRDAFSELLPTEICWKKEKIGYEPPKSSAIFDDKFSFIETYYL
jgi:asparagine synthase (glutamine-hydrolysing)